MNNTAPHFAKMASREKIKWILLTARNIREALARGETYQKPHVYSLSSNNKHKETL